MTDNHNEVNQAAETLHELLQTQTRLADEKAEENRLERIIIEQKQRELDLKDKQLAMELQAEKRRDARIHELLQRLSRLSEQNEAHVAKLISTDDAFGETVQRVIDAQRDMSAALYILLSRNNDDIRQYAPIIQAQAELLKQEANLYKLRLDAADHGPLNVPLKLQNEIAAVEARIEELQARIAAQRGGI